MNHSLNDPARLSQTGFLKACGVDTDAKIAALVDNLVYDPSEIHHVLTRDVGGNGERRYEAEVTFINVAGDVDAVDNLLESLNMRNWRMVCDKFLEGVGHALGIENVDSWDWPMPHARVTKVADPEKDDTVISVKLVWGIDKNTRDILQKFIERKRVMRSGNIRHEQCCKCDFEIPFSYQAGKRLVQCPKCGEIQPICQLCEDNDGQRNCERCKLVDLCQTLSCSLAIVRKDLVK